MKKQLEIDGFPPYGYRETDTDPDSASTWVAWLTDWALSLSGDIGARVSQLHGDDASEWARAATDLRRRAPTLSRHLRRAADAIAEEATHSWEGGELG